MYNSVVFQYARSDVQYIKNAACLKEDACVTAFQVLDRSYWCHPLGFMC